MGMDNYYISCLLIINILLSTLSLFSSVSVRDPQKTAAFVGCIYKQPTKKKKKKRPLDHVNMKGLLAQLSATE
jgi:hypothetical protein